MFDECICGVWQPCSLAASTARFAVSASVRRGVGRGGHVGYRKFQSACRRVAPTVQVLAAAAAADPGDVRGHQVGVWNTEPDAAARGAHAAPPRPPARQRQWQWRKHWRRRCQRRHRVCTYPLRSHIFGRLSLARALREYDVLPRETTMRGTIAPPDVCIRLLSSGELRCSSELATLQAMRAGARAR